MKIIDLLKIKEVKYFNYEGKRYVYLSKEVKKNNISLKGFHNVALIDSKNLIAINHVPTRNELIHFYNNL